MPLRMQEVKAPRTAQKWKFYGRSLLLSWEETIKRASCCSEEDGRGQQGTGTSEGELLKRSGPEEVLSRLCWRRRRTIKLNDPYVWGRIMYTANCQVYTCIPVFLHWILRLYCKLDLTWCYREDKTTFHLTMFLDCSFDRWRFDGRLHNLHPKNVCLHTWFCRSSLILKSSIAAV